MKKDAMGKILRTLMDEMGGPLNELKTLVSPFMEAYALVRDTIMNVKNGWAKLKNTYVVHFITLYILYTLNTMNCIMKWNYLDLINYSIDLSM